MDDTEKKAAVILDVDGVLNGYSNHRFYAQFIYKSIKELSKIHGRKKLLRSLPNLRKAGGFNALFVFAKDFCGNDEIFNTYKRNLVKSLNFDLIPHDPSMKKMIERMGRYGDISIRSDGLDDIAAAAWKRIINNQSSASIKIDMMTQKDQKPLTVYLNNKEIIVSGIEDNKFKTKTDLESWKNFSDKYKIDITKSILMDDSRQNTKTAELLGMSSIHISKLDSLLQDSLGSIFNCSLSDILGAKVSKILRKQKISYGKNVDFKEFFKLLLKNKTSDNNNINMSQNQRE